MVLTREKLTGISNFGSVATIMLAFNFTSRNTRLKRQGPLYPTSDHIVMYQRRLVVL
jgi:hypothetical protein